MVTDPISDFITRITNASAARKAVVTIPYSQLKEAIAHSLEKSGFVKSVAKKGKKIIKTLDIELVYLGDEPRVHGAERISKPSRRIYQRARDIRSFKSGFGAYIFSTPKGILSDVEAKKLKVGGEVLFKIW